MTLRSLLPRLVISGTFVASAAASASAYGYRACDGNPIIWPLPVTPLHAASVSFPDGSAERAALNRARNGWNLSVPGRLFAFGLSYTSDTTWEVGDDVNEVAFTSDYAWGSTTLGVTVESYDCDGIKETDVLFPPNKNWNFASHPFPNDAVTDGPNAFVLVALHELGHALGLRHENRWMATMNYSYPDGGVFGNENDPDPHGDDCNGDRFLYGSTGTARDLAVSIYSASSPGIAGIVSPPKQAPKGSTQSLTFTLLNRGTQNETYTLKVYASKDRWITTGDTLLATATYNQTAGSRDMTVTLGVNIPKSLATGNYYLGFVVDPDNTIPETAEDQNAVGYATTTKVY